MLVIIDYSVIKREDLNLPVEELYDRYATDNTRLLAMTLASNLTGRIIFREEVYRFFKNKGITTFVDSSQGAGKLVMDMKNQGIDPDRAICLCYVGKFRTLHSPTGAVPPGCGF